MPGSTTAVPRPTPCGQALPRTQVPEPCAIVLFGATGDLAHRKLVPALFQLARGGNLPVGMRDRRLRPPRLDRRRSPRRVREDAGQGSGGPDFPEVWSQFASRHRSSRPGTFDDPASYPEARRRPSSDVDRTHRHARQPRLSTWRSSPEFFATIISQLGRGRA